MVETSRFTLQRMDHAYCLFVAALLFGHSAEDGSHSAFVAALAGLDSPAVAGPVRTGKDGSFAFTQFGIGARAFRARREGRVFLISCKQGSR